MLSHSVGILNCFLGKEKEKRRLRGLLLFRFGAFGSPHLYDDERLAAFFDGVSGVFEDAVVRPSVPVVDLVDRPVRPRPSELR